MSEQTFEIILEGKAIRCLKCGMTSHNPCDLEFRYCSHCNLWHEGKNLVNADSEAAFFVRIQAIADFMIRTMPNVKFFLTAHQNPEGGRKGIDIFGVTVVSNMPKDAMMKLLRSIIERNDADQMPGVSVHVE